MLDTLIKLVLSFLNKKPEVQVTIPFDGPTNDQIKEIEWELKRGDSNENGIFGVLYDSGGNQLAVTLERAYPQGTPQNRFWVPKVPQGSYFCQRGAHRLEGMTEPFETFELMNVLGHSNILIHWGNWDRDSEGCILVGEVVQGDMITNSKVTFNKLMALLNGINQFTLVIT